MFFIKQNHVSSIKLTFGDEQHALVESVHQHLLYKFVMFHPNRCLNCMYRRAFIIFTVVAYAHAVHDI